MYKKLFQLFFKGKKKMKNTGTVKWFDPTKGYGFIKPDNGSRDVFVHKSALDGSGLKDLDENQKVEYDTEENKGKISAVNITLVNG